MGIMQPCGLCRAARFKGQMCTGWYVTTVGKENCRFTRMGGSCQISLGGKKKQKNVGSHLLRDEIRKKQMGIEMVPESAS